jgi:hypothetical protein
MEADLIVSALQIRFTNCKYSIHDGIKSLNIIYFFIPLRWSAVF